MGLDIQDSQRINVRGDGQMLPFKDSTFRIVLSLKVLEHIRAPSVFLREVQRILMPGSLFLGSVAFLEPYHDQSYFHFSPLALAEQLMGAGFDVAELQPGYGALSSLLSTAIPTPSFGRSPSVFKLLGGLLQDLLLSVRKVSGFAYARLTRQTDRLWHVRQFDGLRFAGEFSFLAIRR
jgi:SAM-dependent methyltransferase